jgi:hypothetical protein
LSLISRPNPEGFETAMGNLEKNTPVRPKRQARKKSASPFAADTSLD